MTSLSLIPFLAALVCFNAIVVQKPPPIDMGFTKSTQKLTLSSAIQKSYSSAQTSVQPVRVFSMGENGVSCYRIPAVIRTTKGTLLAFSEARYGKSSEALGECSDDTVHQIAMKRSTDNGATWSPVTFAAGDDSHWAGNPYPIALNSGKVALVYVKHEHECLGTCGTGNGVTFSDDDGLSWSDDLDISEGFGPAKGSLPGPGTGVQLQDSGRLLVASHHGANVGVYLSYSDDEGVTWKTLPNRFENMDEATLADLGNGEVLLNMRHPQEHTLGRAVSRSHDNGLTWDSITYDKTLVGPVCQGSLASIGKSVYFSNPANPNRREELTVRRSDDNGKTWPASLQIQSGKSFGYSSLLKDTLGDDNHSGVLYESTSAGSIDFALYPLNF